MQAISGKSFDLGKISIGYAIFRTMTTKCPNVIFMGIPSVTRMLYQTRPASLINYNPKPYIGHTIDKAFVRLHPQSS
jgi:hypothetical protein